VSETHEVGFIGGMKIPLIRKFEAGYVAGVKHVCPACKVLSAYAGTDAGAFADPTTGKELALTQYARGADVIYHASGKTGAGVFNAARERGELAIGVDSDQYHEAPCCVLTSMVKRVDRAVVEAIRAVVEGRFEGGVKELGLAEDGVGFVYDEHNRDLLPAEVVDRVRDLERQIVAGEVEVPWR
jgi:basic membrane protein A